ncbi:MBL fold metallo-hydrolase [Enhygromyxa salina]|uniref:Metal-dependent hydrolase n=1 Tax=Enhygromyxa salina TaxID=215803 RepID=A0A2S9YSB6_9BACT|nr:MBL fold metallo-hydrolase [Enhygromyxa salina]PRQ07983.1 metal-dependent hydrolase [Enhygromyxa salina]
MRVANPARKERIEASPRWIDGAFRNTAPIGSTLQPGTTNTVLREFLFGRERRAPAAPLPAVDPRPGWARPAETGLRVTWLGHSTMLLEIDGSRVLTDPVWGRASPSQLIGPKRFSPVPISIDALPDLDAVVISHNHYDHLDRGAVVELGKRDVNFYTSLGVGAYLESWGIPPERVIEFDWWDSVELPRTGLRITAAPSQHFSGRGLTDRNASLWSAFALQGPRHAVFFSGDTGLTPEYREIAARLGPFDLVMLEVGAFHPAWGQIHLGPDNAVEALAMLGGGCFLPVHWGTFDLGLHPWDEPAERLIELAPSRDLRLLMPKLGAAVEPARAEQVDPWWREIAALEPR